MDTTSRYQELMIEVQNMDRVAARASDGRVAYGHVDLSPLHRRLVDVFERWLGMDEIKRQQDLEVLGSLLFQILFDEDILRLYEDLRRGATRENRLRLQLSFQGDAFEISGYPWEFLYVPDTETRRGYFMATEQNLVLSRFMELDEKIAGDLRSSNGPGTWLIVVSAPDDLDTVLPMPVIEALQKLGQENNHQVVVEKTPTVDRFLQALDDCHPQIVHFIGHAQFNESKKAGEIALLAADQHKARWVPDRLFAEYYSQMQAVPRLLFLHCCEGGKNEFAARFAGLAPQLVRNNIPAVIAMQYLIPNRAALLFSKAFYRELLANKPVDSAAQAGRYALTNDPDYAYDNRVFGTPMLWMRSRSGMILPLPKEAGPQ